ncbi:calpain [Aphelenchoides avenae]|nr:calpain [Aphelenchus avenae]
MAEVLNLHLADPKPIIEDARINSPHYLCQLVVEDPGIQKYTLVVAQYEKSTTINYTLRVYSSTDFECDKVKVPYKVNKKEAGEWKGKTAGGCSNGPSVGENPLYHISLDNGSDENALFVDLRGPKQFSVGVDLWQVSSFRNKPFDKKDSGAFRPGYTIMQADKVPAGTYALRPMTFLPGQEGPFILRVDCSCGFKLKRVQ